MNRRLNIILLALALLGGCSTDDRMPESITVTVGVSVGEGETKAGAAVNDSRIDGLALLVFNDADGRCVWSGTPDAGSSVTITLPGGRGRGYTACALANFEAVSDTGGLLLWNDLGSLTYDSLQSLTFDAADIRSAIASSSVLPMYGEQSFSGAASASVSIPVLRMVDKLTIGTLETQGELLAAGITLGEVTLSFRSVPQVNVSGAPTDFESGDYEASADLLSEITGGGSFYFLAGSTAVFSFDAGGETLSYSLTPTPPTGAQRGNIHYVMTRGVFSSSVLCWPECELSVAPWNTTITIPETI